MQKASDLAFGQYFALPPMMLKAPIVLRHVLLRSLDRQNAMKLPMNAPPMKTSLTINSTLEIKAAHSSVSSGVQSEKTTVVKLFVKECTAGFSSEKMTALLFVQRTSTLRQVVCSLEGKRCLFKK